ncbi:hypothetical protein BJL96_27605 [Burkholderia cenocepacia]|nr:hypothetical protein [Burkholderia cenocepacia]
MRRTVFPALVRATHPRRTREFRLAGRQVLAAPRRWLLAIKGVQSARRTISQVLAGSAAFRPLGEHIRIIRHRERRLPPRWQQSAERWTARKH